MLGLAVAEPPSGYSGYGVPNQSFGSSSSSFGVGNTGGQTYRHVYVHAAPDEPEDQQARVIRIPGKGDKHVRTKINLIFPPAPLNITKYMTTHHSLYCLSRSTSSL